MTAIDKLVQGARKIGVTAIWASYGTGYYWQD